MWIVGKLGFVCYNSNMKESNIVDNYINRAPLSNLENNEFESLKVCEYDLESGLNKLNTLIKDKMLAQTEPILVEIAGGSASGKTSAVAYKVKEFFGNDAVVFSMDDYYRGDKYFTDEAEKGNILNWDQPEAINLDLLSEHLAILKSGKKINKPIYNFKTGEIAGAETFESNRIIILEGLFALDDLLAEQGDIKVFVDISTHGRILRRILRDVERTNQTPSDILKYFSDVVEPMHEKYIKSTKKNADIVIKNEYNPRIEAKRAKDYELQLKFKSEIDSDLLVRLGAKEGYSTNQIDYYCNPRGIKLVDSDEILRIREEADRIILTYKGPKLDSDYRKRPKLEFDIDKDTAKSFLSIYNDYIENRIEKHRTIYQLNDVTFSLDSVTKIDNNNETSLGDFIEINLTNEQPIDGLYELLLKLGLSMGEAIKIPYSEM